MSFSMNKEKQNTIYNFSLLTEKESCRIRFSDNRIQKCIKGSFCQSSSLFDGIYKNTQCTSNSVMALCMSKLKPFAMWDCESVNKVLVQGHELHHNSICSFSKRFGVDAPSSFYLAADEVIPFFNVDDAHFRVVFKLDPYQGFFNQPDFLLTELIRFFTIELFGILTFF